MTVTATRSQFPVDGLLILLHRGLTFLIRFDSCRQLEQVSVYRRLSFDRRRVTHPFHGPIPGSYLGMNAAPSRHR